MSEERRKIIELVARYENEPSLRDIYVEGQFDATVIKWLLREQECDDAVVYEIDTVEIPKDVLNKHGLDEGQKGRVIALCKELESTTAVPGQVTGVVDRDYDALCGTVHESPLLLFTDYSCMEMYCFNEDVLARFFHLFVRKPEYTPAVFFAAAQTVLREGFLLRATNQVNSYGLTWLGIEGQCQVKRDSVTINTAEFIRKYLSRGSKIGAIAEFTQQLDTFRNAVAGQDPRYCINGHDFVRILAKYIAKAMRNKNLADADAVERQLTANIDYAALAAEPLFRELLARAC